MQIYQVDAFTNKPFRGNPAAVCILQESKPDDWLQNVAAEMNLSETAFLLETDDGFDLRWFTPQDEEELCGHATLASAHILWETGLLKPGQKARFDTRSGVLTARQGGNWIYLNFPVEPPQEVEPVNLISKGLGVKPLFVGRNRLDYIVEIESEEQLRQLEPNMNKLNQLETRGIIVTSKAKSTDYDFISRFFAPGIGIYEDPVTGSAHCCLAPFWASKLDKSEFHAYQASSRGGIIEVKLVKDRVILGGQCVIILAGELLE